MQQSPEQASPAQTSPLTMELTDSIGDMFDRDPLEWTEAQIVAMIEDLRARRNTLDVDQKPKAAAKVKQEKAAKVANSSVEDLLKDLGL